MKACCESKTGCARDGRAWLKTWAAFFDHGKFTMRHGEGLRMCYFAPVARLKKSRKHIVVVFDAVNLRGSQTKVGC